jgi:SAM-dependent methyltransferase
LFQLRKRQAHSIRQAPENETCLGFSAEGGLAERIEREKEFFDRLVVEGSARRDVLHRFSEAFYEKGSRGCVWSSFREAAHLKDATVLDYGCGDGDFSIMLAARGARVFGVDISLKLIEQARASAALIGRNRNTPEFLVGDAQRTPFNDATFDYVVGNGALHHLDLEKAFTEIARVLKPGGKAVFLEPMYNHPLLWTLRRLTPKSHTVDERPLSFADIERTRKGFRSCHHREHFLFAVCAAPAHLLGKRFALAVIGALGRVDQVLMRLLPGLRRYAWLTLMEMEKQAALIPAHLGPARDRPATFVSETSYRNPSQP